MKIKSASAFICLILAAASAVLADVKARITYDGAATDEVVNPSAQDNAVILPQGTLPFSRISRMDFEFDGGLTAQQCETLFSKGAFDQLEQTLTAGLKQIVPFSGLPGNLDVYLTWLMKVQYWNGHYAEMNKTVELLRQRNAPSSGIAGLYAVLSAVEQKQSDEAEKMFAAINSPETVSVPMALFIRARLAIAKREYRTALQSLAGIVVQYSRDPEWMPAATLYEGLVYKRTGYLDAAGNVSKELIENYPDGYWARRRAELN